MRAQLRASDLGFEPGEQVAVAGRLKLALTRDHPYRARRDRATVSQAD
jgi:hypothetical protein